MKTLLINGSPNKFGCTYTALKEVSDTLKEEGIQTEIFWIGNKAIRGCIGCGKCKQYSIGRCVFEDDIENNALEKIKNTDSIIIGSPVYFASPNGSLIAFLDRLFNAGKSYLLNKPAAAVLSARRAGTTASFDVLNKYFTITGMPIVSSQYWNMVHGNTPEEVAQDLEGLQTMRTLARNMAWILKAIEAGKHVGIEPPKAEEPIRTNFIR